MSFDVSAEKYDRLVGRYLPELAAAFADAAGIRAGMRVLDVGCGPGGLTRELVQRVGADAVAAVDPSRPFVVACRERNPGVDVREAAAEELPFEDGAFDAALASLVVHFMRDAEAGVREMARVTRPGGVVAACVWDMAGGMTTLRTFWDAATTLDPEAPDERRLVGATEGQLAALFRRAGLAEVEDGSVSASAEYAGFDDWWEPFTFGVGPTGGYCAALEPDRREALREECRRRLGNPRWPFRQHASAWFARGRPLG